MTNVALIARKIVGHFKHSSKAYDQLHKIQSDLDVPTHRLIQDVRTRWSSTYYMFDRLLEQRQVIAAYSAVNKSVPSLTSQQWDLIDSLATILRPFVQLTRESCADSLTLSLYCHQFLC